MRTILDTGVFYRPDALRALRAIDAVVVVPALVVAERRRQIVNAGRDPLEIDRILRDGEFKIEPFGNDEAWRMLIADDATWKRHVRDIMIAAHVRVGDVLWTTNTRDFVAVGLRADQVCAV